MVDLKLMLRLCLEDEVKGLLKEVLLYFQRELKCSPWIACVILKPKK